MSIKYSLFKQNDNIHPDGEKKKSYYPRIVRNRTVRLKELCNRASQGTSFTSSEIQASIELVVRQIEWELLNSNHVCIDGFGTFSLTAESRPVESPDDIRATSITVKRMVFTSSRTLMKKIKHAVFERWR